MLSPAILDGSTAAGRNEGAELDTIHDDQRLEAADVRITEKIASGKGLVTGHIGCADDEDEIGGPSDVIALHNFNVAPD